MLTEHTCPYCNRIFIYDDGVGASTEANIQRLPAYCPVCIDPNRLPGYTYEKDTLVKYYEQYLNSYELDFDSLRDMMFHEFPLTKQYWEATTYRTFTLYAQTPFPDNRFTLGNYRRKRQYHYRDLICNRCKKETTATKGMALCYFFDFVTKICALCDQNLIPRHGNPNPTFGGNIYNGGGKLREDSLRARAKALNVSVNDLRRGITTSEPVLPPGTSVRNLVIIAAYWDERKNVYEPRYLLQCQKCKQKFAIAQKRLNTLEHICLLDYGKL